MSILLQAEIDWVNDHPELYEGEWHQRAIIGNISKMYYIREVKKLISKYEETRTSKAMFDLFEFEGLLDE